MSQLSLNVVIYFGNFEDDVSWGCVYKWAQHKQSKIVGCPLCKAEMDIDKLIPLYTSTENHTKR